MRPLSILALTLASIVAAQKVGNLVPEEHPKLSWQNCSKSPNGTNSCSTIDAEVVLDAEWRWVRNENSISNCYTGNQWDLAQCNTTASCTSTCALEGADAQSYKDGYGITTTGGNTLSQKFVTLNAFSSNVNSRVFLLDPGGVDRYQTFMLMENELAFDVELSSVECAINSALYFVAMEDDGGMARYPTNEAGARYGTGYCDASCPRSNRFVGGKANIEDWVPSDTDQVRGTGKYGACCAEFDVWNSNAHSYSMISKPCVDTGYQVCQAADCDVANTGGSGQVICDRFGCDYNPYRLGDKEFYGKGKAVDTSTKFTVVTQFAEDGVKQFFFQDGKKIETPAAYYPGFPDTSGLSPGYCEALPTNFQDPEYFAKVGGYARQNEALQRPMVLTMSISNDHWANNLWLDSTFPSDRSGLPGAERGPCPSSGNGPEPQEVERYYPNAKVAWSNIRFGPIGTTM
ncbi:glycoside hydrolase [Colletotrichum godetiae]|uniref:Glucanase n=1 Tax=Colletotrichum godetiae TaxID=1209918 RepID=A0AAJ0EUM0_9PEZI|nr:glycoside hydrolase [Colletotrichum godetiae]KAK1672339.1 glycoside hydrolase [Colletotrichum godetiae]